MIKRFLRFLGLSLSFGAFTAFFLWYIIRQLREKAPSPNSLLQDPDAEFSLYRDGEKLIAKWQRTGRADLFLAINPENLRLEKPIAKIEEGQSIILDVLTPNQRHWAELRFEDGRRLQSNERVLPLKSVPNFRDIGGYMSNEGYRIKSGMVYRSSALDKLSPEDSAILEDLGIKLICDVRTSEESIANPDKVPNGAALINLPPISQDNRWIQLGRILFQAKFLENWLFDAYSRVMLQDNPQVIAAFFQRLAQAENYPLIVHCAVGKDRTGIIIALLLEILGVDEATILADYSLSNRHYHFIREKTALVMGQLRFFGLSDEDFDYLLIANPEILKRSLATIREKHGSIEAYLKDYVGLSTEEIEAIRRQLLE